MGRIHQAIRRAEKEAVLASQKVEAPKRLPGDLRVMMTPPALVEPPRVLEPLKVVSTPELGAVEFVNLKPCSKVVVVSAPKSFAAQQYGILKNQLSDVKRERDLTTLLITSASTSEGKTLTAVNLAFTMARDMDSRVLLVDSNLGRPHVGPLLGLSTDRGLVDYLKGRRSKEEIILRTRVSNLSLVCSGHDAQDPTGLLNDQAMRAFLAYVKERFDWVILDSPPFLPPTNVDLISSLADGVLIVVRHSTTSLDLIAANIRSLSGRKLLGCIVNGVPMQGRGNRSVGKTRRIVAT